MVEKEKNEMEQRIVELGSEIQEMKDKIVKVKA